ncbi:ABC-type spermidine/putrescine transport system permease subunit II [Aquamicrobium terrae]
MSSAAATAAMPRLHGARIQRRFLDRLAEASGWNVVAVALGCAALLLIYGPLIWLGVMSFSAEPLSGKPYPLTFAHYGLLFANDKWHTPFLKSVLLGLAVALACMVVGTFLARALVRLRRPGGVLFLALLPLFVPGLTIGAALFVFLRTTLGLKLGMWSLFIGHMVWAFPFALLLILIVTIRFDVKLIQAAEDLGAKPLRCFLDIELPLLMPGISGAGIFSFLLSFNELLRSTFLRGNETTMPVYNWAMASAQQSQVPIVFSLSTLILAVTLPVMGALFFMLFARKGS